ncbi:unnamed protein product [Ostreobium quekettii]|uniref:Uncharacterized protein n=1 Tax=Ostreobium quekettii TaxID=121088 RepID=A0A8S1IUS6_9CHLO|nr:unnamed protein product [Ostreobium quekettii]
MPSASLTCCKSSEAPNLHVDSLGGMMVTAKRSGGSRWKHGKLGSAARMDDLRPELPDRSSLCADCCVANVCTLLWDEVRNVRFVYLLVHLPSTALWLLSEAMFWCWAVKGKALWSATGNVGSGFVDGYFFVFPFLFSFHFCGEEGRLAMAGL